MRETPRDPYLGSMAEGGEPGAHNAEHGGSA